jgi:hypothetical protein
VVTMVPDGGDAPVIFDVLGWVLQQGAEEGEVRRDPIHEEAARRWLSPWRGKPAAR